MRTALLICLCICINTILQAQVTLHRLIRDSMVLQRGEKISIWGWAAPGENIRVDFKNRSYKTKTGTDRKWQVKLSPQQAGGPFTMRISGSNQIVIKDILIGDVWICAGQSNMVHQLSLHRDRYQEEIAGADFPFIRHFAIPTSTSITGPKTDIHGGYWKSASPRDVLQFSAVAYFFAGKLYERYKVPIGLINSSVGGPSIESWMSESSLHEFPALMQKIADNKDTAFVFATNRLAAEKTAARFRVEDQGLSESKPWFDTGYQAKNWRTITVPGYWEDQGIRNLDGIVWYRKEIILSSSITGNEGRLTLGRIVDADEVYVNGKRIGHTTYQYPQRRYSIPAGILKPGRNLLVVRVTNYGNKGGFVPDKPYWLAAGADTMDLKGDWQYKVGAAFPLPQEAIRSIAPEYQPAALYNAMIHPVMDYTIKGVLWYQGEGSTDKAADYEKLLRTMIRDWRARWQQGNIPFLFVQLPGYGDVQYLPVESNWATLREGQRRTLSEPNTGMAVTIDLGEWNDIHPGRKKEVGERLALSALHTAYGEKNLVASGPMYHSHVINSDTIYLRFSQTGSGMVSIDDEPLRTFAIAGDDKKFVWASAQIRGDTVAVWNQSIRQPSFVRYAWADNPDNPNLYNREGLPASPFTTEH